jgi:hypothetical protein
MPKLLQISGSFGIFAGAGWYGLVARGKSAPGLPWRAFHSVRTGQPPEASSMVDSGLVP